MATTGAIGATKMAAAEAAPAAARTTAEGNLMPPQRGASKKVCIDSNYMYVSFGGLLS